MHMDMDIDTDIEWTRIWTWTYCRYGHGNGQEHSIIWILDIGQSFGSMTQCLMTERIRHNDKRTERITT